ncbi:hypothetical protein [Actinomadura macra]|uniref:hypothetical protein n=1 Tax=Actinomadura macra TaxID=46164 RepID=UPI00082D9051|nr:hypothetical protein [Actinomadura macra]
MDRLESAAWPLAGGVFCALLLAVVLKDAAWQVGCAAVVVSVAGWALSASPGVGAVLGLVGWSFVTGFDVGKTGGLEFTGTGDLVRAGVLVGVGLVAGAAGRWLLRLSSPPGRPGPWWPRPWMVEVRDRRSEGGTGSRGVAFDQHAAGVTTSDQAPVPTVVVARTRSRAS